MLGVGHEGRPGRAESRATETPIASTAAVAANTFSRFTLDAPAMVIGTSATGVTRSGSRPVARTTMIAVMTVMARPPASSASSRYGFSGSGE